MKRLLLLPALLLAGCLTPAPRPPARDPVAPCRAGYEAGRLTYPQALLCKAEALERDILPTHPARPVLLDHIIGLRDLSADVARGRVSQGEAATRERQLYRDYLAAMESRGLKTRRENERAADRAADRAISDPNDILRTVDRARRTVEGFE